MGRKSAGGAGRKGRAGAARLPSKTSDKFYIKTRDVGYMEAPKAKQIKVDGFDLFIHRPLTRTGLDGDGWQISEAITGSSLASGRTRKEAIADVTTRLKKIGKKKFKKQIADIAASKGASPRYGGKGRIYQIR